MPLRTVAFLAGFLCMARVARGHAIIVVVGAAVAQRDNVIAFVGGNGTAG
jgi:hypothetical protein